ncbi:MAG: putative Ig domain-containing protein [Methanococcoides sp.]|nr:putative Ig domain-containing protein [Methanococcoides sp.]
MLSFTVSASDADDDTLGHSATNIPSGASIDSSTGAFSWTASEGQAEGLAEMVLIWMIVSMYS